MTLEVATTIGGVTGGLVATVLSASLLGGVFSAVMLVTSLLMLRGARRSPERLVVPSEVGALGSEEPGTLAGAYFDQRRGGMVHYRVTRLLVGSTVSLLAGAVSGMLGVGGGFLKVPAMNLGMGIPMKVAAATSNFMIGVTAVASLFIYFARGFVQPLLAAPLALGVVAGSWAGTRTSDKAQPAMLKRILAAVLVLVAVQMALRAVGVGFDA
jgi:uncharacterized membrane protein YfcA